MTAGCSIVRRISARLARVTIAVALAMLGLACLLSVGARAESLPPYPGIAFPNGAFNSRCAQLSLSGGPTVVEVGQTISASAGPRTDQCGGPASEVSYSWGLPSLGRVVS